MDTVKLKVIHMETNVVHSETIGDRLKAERERMRQTQAAFADLAGCSKPSQVRYEAGNRYPDGSYLEKVARAGADVLFILTGERNAALPDATLPLSGDVRIDGQDYSTIKVYEVEASAGNGLIPLAEEASNQVAFTRSWLLRNGIAADLAGLVRVKGDSMAPTIPDGSYVLVDFRGKADWSVPGIYIVRYDGAILVKRLQRQSNHQRVEGLVILVSDNPAYSPIVVHTRTVDDFQLLARVRMVLSPVS